MEIKLKMASILAEEDVWKVPGIHKAALLCIFMST